MPDIESIYSDWVQMVKIGFKLLKTRILFDTHNNGPLFARKQKILLLQG